MEMNAVVSLKPLLAVLLSLLLPLVLVSSREANIREGWTFVVAAIKFTVIAAMVPAVMGGAELTFTLTRVDP